MNLYLLLQKLIKAIKQPDQMVLYLLGMKAARLLPDSLYLRFKFHARMGRKLNLKNPQSFNGKLQWLKLYDRNPVYTQLADKYEVRKYIKETIGEGYLIPLLGVWERFEDIDFDMLPNQFVLKCTHDSGGVVICKDRSKFNIGQAHEKLGTCLKRNFYWEHREWPYKNIKPRIIAEHYMEDKNNVEIIDYKIMCFNGKAKCAFTCTGRQSKKGLKVTFFDLDWRRMPFERYYPQESKIIAKPVSFNDMVSKAEILTKNISFARIDYYEINSRPFFGEFTLFPGSGYEGFTPEEWDYNLGSWLNLPERE